ncbi:MAG: serine/threonine-protein kinase PknK, partial [Cyanobacteria bacterium J06629_18]
MVLSSLRLHTIPGYNIIELIYSSKQTLVYRAVRETDQKPVVIKLMRNEYPTSQEIADFRNQYLISKNLNTSTVVKSYSLEKYQESYAFVMEDFGGIPVMNEVKNWKLNKIGNNYDFIEKFLDISIKITSAIDEIHRHKVIHKDIKPDNILINPDTKEIKIIDFSISTILPKEVQFFINPDVLEGTLAYISPEQTGRMNRGIDYRTDYYSLGIALFEFLTGQLPFSNDNPLELIYSHISKQAPVEAIINRNFPLVISQIIGKLMSKNPEDRYQSALGLKYDLELCQKNLKTDKRIGHFELATKDISDHFSIPNKLYGRQVEINKLLDAFDRVINPPQHHLAREKEARKGVELMLVKGYPGTGKTAVVNEIHKPILKEKGYFIKGKFNQLQQNIPYLGWIEALNDLIEQLLSESNEQIKQWKTDILSALGDQAQVMIDLIPKLELIIGKQPEAAEISGIEAQNRLGLLFQKLISTFAIRKHPLVIFLDDLQWADAASLNFVQLLMSENATISNSRTLQNVTDIQMPNFSIEKRDEYDDALLLIASYRNNEIDSTHLLNLAIEEIKETSINISELNLTCLNQSDLAFLISDTLKCEVNSIISFTEVVFAKTKGNPFFIHQFINTLYKDEVIKFNYDIGSWECDVANVRKSALTDDVVEFMTLQIQKLPIYTQQLLKIAACVGSQFDLETLSKMSQKSEEATITHLWDSVLQGLVLPVETKADSSSVENQTTELIIDSDDEKKICLGHHNARYFRFIHDRLQQAAYSQIPESEKQQIHLQLGKQLLEKTSAESWEDDIFETANQFNKALSLITLQQERYELAKMNLLAGQKAISSTAYEAALNYLTIGKELLASDSWDSQYQLTLDLYEALAEVTYLTGDFDACEESVEKVLRQANTLLEKIKVYEIKIQAYGAQGKAVEAVETALNVLKHLGIEFPENPTQFDVEQAMEETASNLAGREIDTLADLPEMREAEPLAAMRILSSTTVFAYQTIPRIFLLIILKQMNLSLKHGNSNFSGFTYIAYGLILCGIINDIESGYKFGELAKIIVSQSQIKEVSVKVLETFNHVIRPWKEHIQDTLNSFIEVYSIAQKTGNLEFAGYALYGYSYTAYFNAKELTELKLKITSHSDILKQIKQKSAFHWNQICLQTVSNLLENFDNPSILIGEYYNEKQMLPFHIKKNDVIGLLFIYFFNLHLCYLFGSFSEAIENDELAKKYLHVGIGNIIYAKFYFYDSLTCLALYPEASDSQQKDFLERITANQEKMQHWSNHAPMNFLHKFHLVEAEKNKVLEKNMEAMEFYDLAIAGARE